jgi:head-tail adaptor
MATATKSAGELTALVAFETRIWQPDGGGGHDGLWNEAFRCRARLQPLTGGETVIAGRLQGRQPFVLTVRQEARTKAVTTEYRVRQIAPDGDINRLFKVRAAPSDIDGRRRFLDIMVEEGVAEDDRAS